MENNSVKLPDTTESPSAHITLIEANCSSKTATVEDSFTTLRHHDQRAKFPSGLFFRKVGKKLCKGQHVKRRLPFLTWLPKYKFQWALYDFIAGLAVALTAIPQGIAYAAVAGLPLEHGLYSAFMGPFMYAFFGSVRQITIGPTIVTSVMTRTYSDKGGVLYAVMLAFFTGTIIVGAGFLNLGFFIEFISGPVISGFCSAAAVMVSIVQLKTLLGLKFKGSSVTEVICGIFTHIGQTRIWDCVLGVCCIVTLLLLKNLTLLQKKFQNTACGRSPFVDKLLWFLSVSRNALVVMFCCFLAYCFEQNGQQPFTLTGHVKAGLPTFQLPWTIPSVQTEERLSSQNSSLWNTTSPSIDIATIGSDIGAGLILVPLIAILEQVAIAKAFSAGKRTDCTQEMIALGLGTFMGSFVGAMPITASFSRSSVQSSSKAKTPFANFFNGCVILLALGFLMPAMSYIPRPVLASVIITAVFSMIEYEEIMPMWRGRRTELIPFLATFFCCLFINMEYGILVGAGIHLLIFTYKASTPKTRVLRIPSEGDREDQIVIQFDRALFFPGVEKLRSVIQKTVSQDASTAVVLDLGSVPELDYTAIKMLKTVVAELNQRKQSFYFANANWTVEKTLRAVLPSSSVRIISALGYSAPPPQSSA